MANSIRSTLLAAVFAAAFTCGMAAYAHHSPAGFNTSKSHTVTGVVTQYEWYNPHVYILLEETSAEGKKVEWEIECAAPAMMTRIGWSKQSLRVGDLLTISGSPSKKADSKALLAGTIKRADATLMDTATIMKQFSQPPKETPFVAKSLEGTWESQTPVPLIVQESFPDASKLTAEGARIFKSFDEKAMSPASNCISYTSPNIMVMPDLKRIVARPDSITIQAQLNDAQRTIHLNATHAGAIPSHQGHSIGKWEGKALVIDTTHFAYHGSGNGIGLPSSAKKHLIERFTPSEDGKSLTYSFELSDPDFLKEPRVGKARWVFRPDQQFVAEPCNLESARRYIKH